MAKCGFYSYDKSKLGDFEDTNFHLVAWPGRKINENKNPLIFEKIISINSIIPTDLNSFDLSEYIE